MRYALINEPSVNEMGIAQNATLAFVSLVNRPNRMRHWPASQRFQHLGGRTGNPMAKVLVVKLWCMTYIYTQIVTSRDWQDRATPVRNNVIMSLRVYPEATYTKEHV